MTATGAVSGLSSGLDWRKILDQLRQLDHKKIDLIENRKKGYSEKLSAWQGINSKFLSLKNAAGMLNKAEHFNLYSTSLSSNTTAKAEDILFVTAGKEASFGTYRLIVHQLASAQKLSSKGFNSQTSSLGLSGDILVGGRTVKVAATDTLSSLRDKFNSVNTGTGASKVTASIVNYGSGGFRLILTSDEEGSDGIGLLNGGGTDLIGALGFVDGSPKTAKHAISGGHRSDLLSAADMAVGGPGLLNLTDPQSGELTLVLNGVSRDILIDLATDSLNSIRDSINAAFNGVFSSDPASVVSETVDGKTTHRLLIEGASISYADSNNILETLGILRRGGFSDERGLTGDIANTSGGRAILSDTLIKEIDGYHDYVPGDTITLGGMSTGGASVHFQLVIEDSTTVGDLLAAIQNQYGEVSASVTADGRIQIVDNEIGDTDLAVLLTPERNSLRFDSDHDFGPISTLRSRELQAGANAVLSMDGVTLTPSSNLVKDVLPGITLNLRGAAPDTTVTLSVKRDETAIQEKVREFVDAYNAVMEAIHSQMAYNADTGKPGGPLFGDSALRSIRSNLASLVLSRVSEGSDTVSTLGLAGIRMGANGLLILDEAKFKASIETSFEDIRKLFAVHWSSSNSHLSYIYHSHKTQPGDYDIQITEVNPVSGYFITPGDANGTGEYLTGISGNASGLVVRYSGTATGAIGKLSLHFGIAELFDRLLYGLTNPTTGAINGRREVIQNTINNLEEDVRAMESRLDQKMAKLERQFVAMESALSRLQSQSGWLTGQINAVYKGWW